MTKKITGDRYKESEEEEHEHIREIAEHNGMAEDEARWMKEKKRYQPRMVTLS